VAEADKFYADLLSKDSWRALPTDYPPTEQYSDLRYQKQDYHLRVSIGQSGDEGEVSVNLSNLGNQDLQALPRPEGTEPHPASEPTNASFLTELGIREVAEFCQQELTELGWQQFTGMDDRTIDVPHYKSLSFLKNATRFDVSISKNPRQMSEKTMVAYMAQAVLAFDVPMIACNGILRLDPYGESAEYQSSETMANVVAFYQQPAEKLHWKQRKDDSHVGETAASLSVEDEPEMGLVISIGQKDDATRVTFQRVTFREEEDAGSQPSVADLAPNPPASSEDSDVAEAFRANLEAAIRNELDSGVLDELKKAGGPDIEALVGDLFREQEDAEDTASAEESEPGVDSAIEPGTGPTDAEIAGRKASKNTGRCTVKLGDESFEFKHAVAYRAVQFDEPITVIMMCEKAIPQQKLIALLGREEKPSSFELFQFDIPDMIEVALSGGYASINCFVDGSSIGIGSSDIEIDIKAPPGRVHGKVRLDEPHEMFDKPFLFQMSFDLPVLTADPNAPSIPEGELAANPAYDHPVPEETTSIAQERSQYRSVIEATIDAEPEALTTFYRKQYIDRGWEEKPSVDKKRLVFARTGETATVKIEEQDGESYITLATRNESLAKEHNIAPVEGKTRFLLGNATEGDVTITINGQPHTVASGVASRDPKDAVRIDVEPGTRTVAIQVPGQTVEQEDVQAEPGTAWGVIVIPTGGYFLEQMY
jgi:hypothetical protein